MAETLKTQASVRLEGNLITNGQGIKRLLEWHDEARKSSKTQISTDFTGLDWIDANLAALWSALIHKLKMETGSNFALDEGSLSKRFSILIRNGFSAPTNHEYVSGKTFIQNACFGPTEEDRFTRYIETQILSQIETVKLPKSLLGLLESNLQELYQNVFRHAGTNEPFFVCGQYYPKKHELIVSMVDLGITFLPPIERRTNGSITSQQQAIIWALQGNSELGNEGGGHALKCILDLFSKSGHTMQIATGDTFWDSSCENTVFGPFRKLNAIMPGTMVNLIFKTPRPR